MTTVLNVSTRVHDFDFEEEYIEDVEEFMELFEELLEAFADIPDVRVLATLEDEYYFGIWTREAEGVQTGDYEELQGAIIMFPLDPLSSVQGHQWDLVVNTNGRVHEPVMHDDDRRTFGSLNVDSSTTLREYALAVRRHYLAGKK